MNRSSPVGTGSDPPALRHYSVFTLNENHYFMFKAKTELLKRFAGLHPERIKELEAIFDCPTHVYIDFANVRKRFNWRIDFEKLKDLFDSFSAIQSVSFYFGTIEGDRGSEGFIRRIKKIGFHVITKPVKIIRIPINASSISSNSPDLLRQFVDHCLMEKLKLQAIEYMNQQIADLNKQSIFYLEHPKCNFDVEIGVDMKMDHRDGKCTGFCLWSADSDFASTVEQIMNDGGKVVVFSAGGKVSFELNALTENGLKIYDPKKLKLVIERE